METFPKNRVIYIKTLIEYKLDQQEDCRLLLHTYISNSMRGQIFGAFTELPEIGKAGLILDSVEDIFQLSDGQACTKYSISVEL